MKRNKAFGFWRRFCSRRLALVGGSIVFAFLLSAVLAPFLSPHDPLEGDLGNRFKPPVWMEGGDWVHPLGCDQMGRDILSRTLYGARISILVGIVVIVFSAVIGTLLGIFAGYFGGWIDIIISRIVDVLLAFPFMLFAIGMMAFLQAGLMNIIMALALKGWVPFCRLARGDTLSVKTREHVEAARAVGAGCGYIITREIIPNIFGPVVVLSTLNVAFVILLEATLSFLGLGIQPPYPSWGAMISEGRAYILEEWWISGFPGLAILLLVLGVNLLGENLRDILDPKISFQQ